MDDYEQKREFQKDADQRREAKRLGIEQRKATQKILFDAAVTHDHRKADATLGIRRQAKTGPTSPPRPPFQLTPQQEFNQRSMSLVARLDASGLPHHETQPWVSKIRSIDLREPAQGKAILTWVHNQFAGTYPLHKPAVTMWDASEASEFSLAMQMVDSDFSALGRILDRVEMDQ